jgi:hypothetical protein
LFEFHGWAKICVDDQDDPDLDLRHRREEEAIGRLREAMQVTYDGFSFFDLRRTSNEIIALSVQGLRNHRYEQVIDLFRWIAAELPFSYGLLHVHDDEDSKRGADFKNESRVWRLARGMLSELADPFLSPCVPTVEPPWEGAS